MDGIDPRWLRAARLAGATLVAVGAFDIVLRGDSLSRNEDGAILLAAGLALLVLHVVLARRDGRDSTDALLAAALAVPFVPVGVALLVYSPPSAASLFTSGGDLISPYRDAASAGLLVAAMAFAGAYALTRHPRWVLVVALAIGFGAELQSPAPVPIFFGSADSWTPALIIAAAGAVALAAAWRAPEERRTTEPGRGRSDHARRCGRGEGVRRDRRRRPRPLPRRAPGRPGRDRLVADRRPGSPSPSSSRAGS